MRRSVDHAGLWLCYQVLRWDISLVVFVALSAALSIKLCQASLSIFDLVVGYVPWRRNCRRDQRYCSPFPTPAPYHNQQLPLVFHIELQLLTVYK